MPVTADTTIIAQALGTARACARQARASGRFDPDMVRAVLEAVEDALPALKRIEDEVQIITPPTVVAGVRLSGPSYYSVKMNPADRPLAGEALAVDGQGRLTLASTTDHVVARMVEDYQPGRDELVVDWRSGRAANSIEALRR